MPAKLASLLLALVCSRAAAAGPARTVIQEDGDGLGVFSRDGRFPCAAFAGPGVAAPRHEMVA